MSAHERNTAPSRGDSAWIVALALLCLGILGYGFFFSNNTVSAPAFLAGKYLVHALLVWGVFHAIFLRKRGANINAIAFIAIYGSLFLSGLIGASQKKQQLVTALSSMHQEYARAASQVVDSTGLPAGIERSPATTPQAMGEYGEIERFFREFLDRLVALRSDYLIELEATGWNSVLDAQRIRSDARLSESRVMIERAKASVDSYEQKTSALLQDTRLRIGTLDMSESTRRRALEVLDESMGRAGAQLDQQWSLERQVIRQLENIVQLLAASKGWVVEGEHILFSSDAELDRFNSYIQEIQQTVLEQEQIRKNSYAEVNQRFEALRNAAAR